MRASAACRLPTCLCSRPERERIKTSNSGQSGCMTLSCLRCAPRALLRGVRGRSFPHPPARFVGRPPRLEPLAVAGTVAPEHGLKLRPVDRPDAVALRRLVPAQLLVGNAEAEVVRLRHGDVDEFLAELVVAEALDLPAHRLGGVLRVRIARTEHHERRPPPAIERILRHGALLAAALREGHHDLEPRALMEA